MCTISIELLISVNVNGSVNAYTCFLRSNGTMAVRSPLTFTPQPGWKKSSGFTVVTRSITVRLLSIGVELASQ